MNRGPDDYDRRDEIIERLVEAIHESKGDYHEKGNNAWTAGIGATLLVAFILGGWSLSNQVAAEQAEQKANQLAQAQMQIATQRQIDDLKAEIQDLKQLLEQKVHS